MNKRVLYITGFLFAAAALAFAVYKIQHIEMPQSLFYVFSAISICFFALLIFSLMQKLKK